MKLIKLSYLPLLLFALHACAQEKNKTKSEPMATISTDTSKLDTATVGGGCYWCTEAQYQLPNIITYLCYS